MEPLDVRFRPQTFDAVLGQDASIESIKTVLASDHKPKAFMLIGPTGVGKTTTARLIAKSLGCTKTGLIEIDAASSGQIDDIRALVGDVSQRALGSPVKVYIIDECHNISKKAFEAFLKTIEEPPKHVTFIFCTTDPKDIPQAVIDRCHKYEFTPISEELIRGYLEIVVEDAKIKTTSDIMDLVAITSKGCMRRALVQLSTVAGITDFEQAHELIKTTDTEELSGEFKTIAQMMVKGEKKWAKYHTELRKIPAEKWSNMKPMFLSYISATLLSTPDEARAMHLAVVLDAIEQMPTYPASFEYKSALLTAIWRVILN